MAITTRATVTTTVTAATHCGYGVQTEVYVTDDNDVYLIFINTYLAVAEDDYDSDDGTLEVTCYGGLNEPYEDQDITLEDDEFDIDGYVEGDYLSSPSTAAT